MSYPQSLPAHAQYLLTRLRGPMRVTGTLYGKVAMTNDERYIYQEESDQWILVDAEPHVFTPDEVAELLHAATEVHVVCAEAVPHEKTAGYGTLMGLVDAAHRDVDACVEHLLAQLGATWDVGAPGYIPIQQMILPALNAMLQGREAGRHVTLVSDDLMFVGGTPYRWIYRARL